MIPELVTNDAFNTEAMILESLLNIINGFKELFDTMVRAPNIIHVSVP